LNFNGEFLYPFESEADKTRYYKKCRDDEPWIVPMIELT
jgi:hypothetical protein